jgi:hypothetical protein
MIGLGKAGTWADQFLAETLAVLYFHKMKLDRRIPRIPTGTGWFYPKATRR